MEEKLGRGKVALLWIAVAGVIGYLVFDDVGPRPAASPEVAQTPPAASLPAAPSKPPAESPKAIEKPIVESTKAAEKPSLSFRETVNKSIADAQKDAIKNAHKVMIDSSMRQYEIVKRQGSATDVCMHASMIQGAYLGAEDEVNYAKWRVIAESDCKAAGVPTL